MSKFPAVATVLGVSEEVAKSGPLLATLAIDPRVISTPPPPPEPIDIKVGDPVTQAVVDNIIGKLPTKKEPVRLRCDICDVTVSSQEILITHMSGAKHARKLESLKLKKEISQSADAVFITSGKSFGGIGVTEYTCKACNIKVNSYQQLEQHFSGTKHKNKAEKSKSNTMEMSVQTTANQAHKGEDVGVVNVDIGPNKLFCAACNVHVNSDLQLHQHITSAKHKNKVNGRAVSAPGKRSHPYSRGGRRWNTSSGGERGLNNSSERTGWNSNKVGTGWNKNKAGPGWNNGAGAGRNDSGPGAGWNDSGTGASWDNSRTGTGWNNSGAGDGWNNTSTGGNWNFINNAGTGNNSNNMARGWNKPSNNFNKANMTKVPNQSPEIFSRRPNNQHLSSNIDKSFVYGGMQY